MVSSQLQHAKTALPGQGAFSGHKPNLKRYMSLEEGLNIFSPAKVFRKSLVSATGTHVIRMLL